MKSLTAKILLFAWGFATLFAASQSRGDTILASKHDLSVAGPGTIKASTETEVCMFCHTPHKATGDQPLWNHSLSTAVYTPYSSSTTKAAVGQPTGASKLCLSCHDGTVALGMVNSRTSPIQMQNGVSTLASGRTSLGTDLSDDHPVSFTYNSALTAANGQLKDPSTLNAKVHLDHNNQMQCTSCHDPHDNQYGKFLVQNPVGSALCLNCHDMNFWQSSIHRTSTKTWNGSGVNPWPHTSYTTVADNGCESCHAPHNAGTKQRLLTFANEEQNCFSCHSGNVAAKNVQTEFNKPSVHPILATTGVHDPMEDPINPPRHVECADCHNPHGANSATASAPNASGALAGVAGINTSGSLVKPIASEYELCFRCHADSVAKGPARVPRQYPETNKRLQFGSANASYHPVTAIGKNPTVPSLLPAFTTSSQIYCTDCHNSDDGPGTGGTGAKGPHGSVYTPLLERQQILTDGSSEGSDTYALCYKCHNRSVVLSDQSFKGHLSHVTTYKVSCTTCHDSHGTVNANLINFNTTYVSANSTNGILAYTGGQATPSTCTLNCHSPGYNADHNNATYSTVTPLTLKTKAASSIRK